MIRAVEMTSEPVRAVWKVARAPLARLGPQAAQSGAAVARRTFLLMVLTIVVANLVGAIVVFVFAVWVVPNPDVDDTTRAILTNLVAFGIYVAFALFVGVVWGFLRLKPVRDWLRDERRPSKKERRLVLLAPVRLAAIAGALWSLAVVVFTTLNAFFSSSLAIVVAITVALGGVVTSAGVALLTERIMRAAMARALAYRPPSRPVPGMMARSIMAFALGVGVPLLGMLLIGAYALADAEVTRNQLAITILGLGGCAMVVGLMLTLLATRAATDPVLSVRDAMRKVEQDDLDVELAVYDASEVGLLQAGFNRMVAGLRDRRRIREAFGTYVDHEVAEHILEEGVSLEGEEVEVTLMFIDIRDFTRWAESVPAREVVEALNGLFEKVVPVIHEHRGHVDKFVGDGLLGVFGAPQRSDDHADQALRAALEICSAVTDDRLDIGIGLNSGTVVAGNVGGGGRLEFSVIGDAVNVAARIEGATRETGDPILLSAETAERLKGDYELEPRERVELRGKAERVTLHAASP